MLSFVKWEIFENLIFRFFHLFQHLKNTSNKLVKTSGSFFILPNKRKTVCCKQYFGQSCLKFIVIEETKKQNKKQENQKTTEFSLQRTLYLHRVLVLSLQG